MSGFDALRKIQAGLFSFLASLFQHVVVPTRTSSLLYNPWHVM